MSKPPQRLSCRALASLVRLSLMQHPVHTAVVTAAQGLHSDLLRRDPVIDAGSAHDWELTDHAGAAA